MTEDNNKHCEIKEVINENELLQSCMARFSELEERVENAQLMTVQGKYQYFLRKFQKITEEHQKHKDLYENIQKTVEESHQIKEENRSIEFINKIMEDTQKKYNRLKEQIEGMRTQKQQDHAQMAGLRRVLLQVKNEYFELQRQEQLKEDKKRETLTIMKQKQNVKTMFKIRQQKRIQLKQSSRIKPMQSSMSNLNQSVMQRHILTELQTINSLKDQFLRQVGTTLKDCHKGHLKELSHKEQANKLINKRKDLLRNQSNMRFLGDYDPQENAVEVFNIVKNHDRQLQEFMQLSASEVIELIVRKNKVKEVMALMEEEKRIVVQTYEKTKMEKIRTY